MKKYVLLFLSTSLIFKACDLREPIVDLYFTKIIESKEQYSVNLFDGVELNDGSFILAGYSSTRGNGDALLVKLRPNGEFEIFPFGNPQVNEEVTGFTYDNDYFYLSGRQTVSGQKRGLVMRIDRNMNEVPFLKDDFSKEVFGSDKISYRKISKSKNDPNSLYILKGYLKGITINEPPLTSGVKKFNLRGEALPCSASDTFIGYQEPNHTIVLSNGNFLVAGNAPKANFWVFNESCNILTKKTNFEGTGSPHNYVTGIAEFNGSLLLAVNEVANLAEPDVFKSFFYNIDIANNYRITPATLTPFKALSSYSYYAITALGNESLNEVVVFSVYFVKSSPKSIGSDLYSFSKDRQPQQLATYPDIAITKILKTKSGSYLLIANRGGVGKGVALKVSNIGTQF